MLHKWLQDLMRNDHGQSQPAQRDWTFMVYMAGDNELDGYGDGDLAEMKQVGSSRQVAVVAQRDFLQPGPTRRYFLRRDTTLAADQIAELGETNTGDPRELARFAAWAMRAYPAARYALVLWNHGMGWKEDRGVIDGGATDRRQGAVKRLPATPPRCHKGGPLFTSGGGAAVARGLAFDQTSGDFLDNYELQQALRSALDTGKELVLALLGFDACLMSMVEVAYQLRDVCRIMVSSQEVEAGPGWPYAALLRSLCARPEMDEVALARSVVTDYIASCRVEGRGTLSALDLELLDVVVVALNDLSKAILDQFEECRLALGYAARRAQAYADPDYKDLYDLCRLLASRCSGGTVRERARAMMRLLSPAEPGRFVAAEAHLGDHLARSHGVSIYLPAWELSPLYGRLDFATDTLWDSVLWRLLRG